MAHKIRDVMTPDPITCDVDDSAVDAARAMKDHAIGDVIVLDGGRICGVVTDRDLAVRIVSEGRDASATPLRDVCSREVATLGPDDDADHAVRLMTRRAIRRVPIVERGAVVGIVSIGDLAMKRDARSALATLSAAAPNS
jgi:CBS domain-containing protein